MKSTVSAFFVLVALLGTASRASAGEVQYVKICSLYGSGFNYLPGTDICWNAQTGDARQQTSGGTWRTILPYPEGEWAQGFKRVCQGKLVKVGDFASTDFVLNEWERKQTAPFPLVLPAGQIVTKVIMSGGFYDPRVPAQAGSNGTLGLCIKSKDPTVLVPQGDPPDFVNPPWGDDGLPIGCIANERIVRMTLPYAITATAAYPQTYSFFNGETAAGPFTYGRQLVVTTDVGVGGPLLLTYHDSTTGQDHPLAGTLTVHVCIGGAGIPKP